MCQCNFCYVMKYQYLYKTFRNTFHINYEMFTECSCIVRQCGNDATSHVVSTVLFVLVCLLKNRGFMGLICFKQTRSSTVAHLSFKVFVNLNTIVFQPMKKVYFRITEIPGQLRLVICIKYQYNLIILLFSEQIRLRFKTWYCFED